MLPTELQSKFECLFIEVPTQNEHIVIGLMYRSPSHDSIAEVNHFLRTTIEQLNLEKKTIILLGDVNINLLKANSNPNISYYLDLMLSYNLLPAITLPTRITASTATLIDHIFTNAPHHKINCGTIRTDITDHFTNFIFIESTKPDKRRKNPTHVSYRPITDKTIAQFNNSLTRADWTKVYNTSDSSESYANFISIYKDCLEKSIPIMSASPHVMFYCYRNIVCIVVSFTDLLKLVIVLVLNLLALCVKMFKDLVAHLVVVPLYGTPD